MTKLKQILEYIKTNPGETTTQISIGTGIKHGTVRTSVSTLCGRGDMQMMRSEKAQSTYRPIVNVLTKKNRFFPFINPLHRRPVSQ